jgi:ABC-type multidrug transport system ATPase subunit
MLLRFQSVCFQCGTTKLLDDVDFEISNDERIVLTGGPLSGKSLILHLAVGLVRPSSGRIDGLSTERSNHAGVVFDTASLLGELTLRRNLRYFGMLYGMWGRMLKRRIDEVAEGLGATGILGRRVSDLDLRDLCIADIARAVIHRPRLLWIDECHFGPDRARDDEVVKRLLTSGLSDGMAVVIVRRRPPETDKVLRMMKMDGGRLVCDGPLQAEAGAGQRPDLDRG